jgi:hypothetical protein
MAFKLRSDIPVRGRWAHYQQGEGPLLAVLHIDVTVREATGWAFGERLLGAQNWPDWLIVKGENGDVYRFDLIAQGTDS